MTATGSIDFKIGLAVSATRGVGFGIGVGVGATRGVGFGIDLGVSATGEADFKIGWAVGATGRRHFGIDVGVTATGSIALRGAGEINVSRTRARFVAPSTMRIALLTLAFLLAFAPTAHAGDRGLYLAFIDARGMETVDAARDALEHTLFNCGSDDLATCRTSHGPESDFNTAELPLYAIPSADVNVQAALRATRSARARAVFQESLGTALDGVVIYRPEANGSVSLVLLNMNRGTVSRLTTRDGLSPAQRTRALRFLAGGLVP